MADSKLYQLLFAWKCSSAHHKLALDSLRHLQHSQAEGWRDAFLYYIEAYLDGSKAPDDRFKDFKNHVLHVRQNNWGGALATARAWYPKTVQLFREKRWGEAIFSAGVLSHYLMDPFQPFHTGQTEAEGAVHRAAEWSVACAYTDLQAILEHDLGGYPEVNLPTGETWLEDLILWGANQAHPHYEILIDHYNLEKGRKKPIEGLDQECRDRFAKLIGVAVKSWSLVLDRIFTEADVTPPGSPVTLLTILGQMTIPIFAVTKHIRNAEDRAEIEQIYREFKATGKVIGSLPESERVVRAEHAVEVLKKPIAELNAEKPRLPGTAYGTGTATRPIPSKAKPAKIISATKEIETKKSAETPVAPSSKTSGVSLVSKPDAKAPSPSETAGDRYYLRRVDPLEKAAGIGPKTAALWAKQGIRTVEDFLKADLDRLGKQLQWKPADLTQATDWRDAASLQCDVPRLRGHDVLLLVGAGIREVSALVSAAPNSLIQRVQEFANEPAGRRILRDAEVPDEAEVRSWIAAAQSTVSNSQSTAHAA